jgi:hypothetical protein
MQGGLRLRSRTNLVLAQGTCQTLCTPSSRDRSNLDLGETKHGIFGGVDNVALQSEMSLTCTHICDIPGLTAREISKPPPN